MKFRMNHTNKIFGAIIFATLIGITGCEEKGPLEKAGEKMDEAAKDLGNAVEDACEDIKEGAGVKNKNC